MAAVPGERSEEEQIVGLYREVVQATVHLASSFGTGAGRRSAIGSGFLIDDAGTVVTNAHVVQGAHQVVVKLYDGQRVKAEETFPPKTRPLARKSDCAEIGLTGGAHDTETAHGGTDHCGAQGCPGGHRDPGALSQAQHLGRYLL